MFQGYVGKFLDLRYLPLQDFEEIKASLAQEARAICRNTPHPGEPENSETEKNTKKTRCFLVVFLLLMDFDMCVSKNRGGPQIIYFNRVFHYEPSILGYCTTIFGNTHMGGC